MIQRLINLALKYRLILICLFLLGVFGYSLWRLPAISNPEADPQYLKQQQTQVFKLEIKDSLRKQLEQLVETPVDTQPDSVGRPDPFNP